MIVYLDASAIVKRYLAEASSTAVNRLVTEAAALGTSLISRAEVGLHWPAQPALRRFAESTRRKRAGCLERIGST